jgi:flagellar basal-body rod protein FlgF
MSFKGIYAALSGSMAQALKIDTIANNIANVNTTGFKKDQQTFGEYLTAIEKNPEVIEVPKITASIESFYNNNGTDKSFVDSTGTYTNFEQGSLKHTAGKLDVALDGEGFFEIATAQGVKLTRAGNFTIDNEGRLVTKDGHTVVVNSDGQTSDPLDGEAKRNSVAQFSGLANAYISENGEVFDGDKKLGKLSIIKLNNPEALQKVGHSFYEYKSNMTPDVVQMEHPSLKQGYLETSNVNIVAEMTDMIMAQRVFEGTQKAIQAYDQMEDKAINQVGNTKG